MIKQSTALLAVSYDCSQLAELYLHHLLCVPHAPKQYWHIGLDMLHMKHQSMLQCMHTLESAGKSFGDKKLQDLSELGELVKSLCLPAGEANAHC